MPSKKLKVAFIGGRPMGAKCLDHLYRQPNVDIVGACLIPGELTKWYAGRGSVTAKVNELGIPIVTEDFFLSQPIDILIYVLADVIVKEPLLSHPRLGCVNSLHFAELPRYGGCNSIAHAIINARKDNYWQHGVTMMYMDAGIDTGPIIAKRFCPIYEDDTGQDLYLRIERVGFELFKDMLPKLLSGKKLKPILTNYKHTYYYSRKSLSSKQVNLKWPADKIYDFVRALQFPPNEPAYILVGDKKIYLTIK